MPLELELALAGNDSMENRKPNIRERVVFEKTGATGSSEILLTLYGDDSVYLQGAVEAIFEGETPLESALEYLQEKGYKKKDLSP